MLEGGGGGTHTPPGPSDGDCVSRPCVSHIPLYYIFYTIPYHTIPYYTILHHTIPYHGPPLGRSVIGELVSKNGGVSKGLDTNSPIDGPGCSGGGGQQSVMGPLQSGVWRESGLRGGGGGVGTNADREVVISLMAWS